MSEIEPISAQRETFLIWSDRDHHARENEKNAFWLRCQNWSLSFLLKDEASNSPKNHSKYRFFSKTHSNVFTFSHWFWEKKSLNLWTAWDEADNFNDFILSIQAWKPYCPGTALRMFVSVPAVPKLEVRRLKFLSHEYPFQNFSVLTVPAK